MMENNSNLFIQQEQLQTEVNNCSEKDSVLIEANFKIGDFVLPISSEYSNEVCELTEWYIKDLDFRYKTKFGGWGVIVKARMPKTWRHATSAEIKSGYRMKLEADYVSGIRNHISPLTVVIDVGGEG